MVPRRGARNGERSTRAASKDPAAGQIHDVSRGRPEPPARGRSVPLSSAPRYSATLSLDDLFEEFLAASASIINDRTEKGYRYDCRTRTPSCSTSREPARARLRGRGRDATMILLATDTSHRTSDVTRSYVMDIDLRGRLGFGTSRQVGSRTPGAPQPGDCVRDPHLPSARPTRHQRHAA